MFQPRGQILVSGKGLTEDRVMEVALEAGALDVQAAGEDEDEGTRSFVIFTEVGAFGQVRDAAEAAKLHIEDAQLTMIPDTTTAVVGDVAKQVLDLVDALEDLDDVQKVYTNADISGE
jgi:transcriptional/translational regulatory protein YebC/TACO1